MSRSDRARRLLVRVRRGVLRRRRLLAAALTAVAVGSGVHAVVAPPPPRITVLVAARDLPAGSVLARADLAEASYAPGTVPDGLAADAAGRVLAAPLRRGEPVTDVRLVGPALTDGYPGLTAVPVRFPDAGAVALLRVGDRVDVVAADPQGAGATTVAADAPVLAIPAADRSEGTQGRLVVLGVPDGDVERLADAAVRFFLTFALSQ
ncbi:Flp pilus assembly protein CpaB [Nocardioides ginsengisegetis]|uniref:Flp pilus assembly protein CpaB n=1 Tax=Nocardioides ginsengisegetis TaxID=661491 RepID=A0A7W3J2A6_9ACTN|nr:SAF domain-containing protein [Nocardioides ginsengisegetis]MBA8804983.1 Flp pilus assembly protein CpaB [Nocardioides ginsengisegetis]